MHAATRRMLNCMYMDMANANAHDFARSFAFARDAVRHLEVQTILKRGAMSSPLFLYPKEGGCCNVAHVLETVTSFASLEAGKEELYD